MAKQVSGVGTPDPLGSPDSLGTQWVLTAINALTKSVGQIEGKLDGVITKLDENATKTAALSADLHALSRKVAYAAGGLAVVLAVVGFVFYSAVNIAISFTKEAIHSGVQKPAVVEQPQPVVPKSPSTAK